jgi:hypothetical protein
MFFAAIAHLTRLHTNPAPPIVLLALCAAAWLTFAGDEMAMLLVRLTVI